MSSFFVVVVSRGAGKPVSSCVVEGSRMAPSVPSHCGRLPVYGKDFVRCLALCLCGHEVVPFFCRFARGKNGFGIAENEEVINIVARNVIPHLVVREVCV